MSFPVFKSTTWQVQKFSKDSQRVGTAVIFASPKVGVTVLTKPEPDERLESKPQLASMVVALTVALTVIESTDGVS